MRIRGLKDTKHSMDFCFEIDVNYQNLIFSVFKYATKLPGFFKSTIASVIHL